MDKKSEQNSFQHTMIIAGLVSWLFVFATANSQALPFQLIALIVMSVGFVFLCGFALRSLMNLVEGLEE